MESSVRVGYSSEESINEQEAGANSGSAVISDHPDFRLPVAVPFNPVTYARASDSISRKVGHGIFGL